MALVAMVIGVGDESAGNILAGVSGDLYCTYLYRCRLRAFSCCARLAAVLRLLRARRPSCLPFCPAHAPARERREEVGGGRHETALAAAFWRG